MCKVSIIVPVYNAEKHIRQCFESLVNQTMKDIEIIAINDGSTDKSLSILEEYKEKYPDMVRIYSYENQGVSHARNYGMHLAKGKYIAFVDSDDYCELDMYEKLVAKAEKDGNDLVVCGRYDFVDGAEDVAEMEKKYSLPINQNFKLKDCKYELAKIRPFPWDKLFRADLIKHFEFPEDIRFEDMVLTYEILTKAESIGTVREQLYYYRRNTQGSFLNTFSDKIFDLIKAYDRIIRYYKAYEIFDYYKEELEYICIRHTFIRYDEMIQNGNAQTLDLKIKMVTLFNDFLDSFFPDWRNNRYKKYSMSKDLTKYERWYQNTELFTKGLKEAVQENRRLVNIWNSELKEEKKKVKEQQQATTGKKEEKTSKFYKSMHPPIWYKYVKAYEKDAIREKSILLESKHGDDLAGNIFRFAKELSDKEYKEYDVYLAVKKEQVDMVKKKLETYELLDRIKVVLYMEESYVTLLATAKYLITDTSFPPFFIKREEQVYLNTWHGTPFKGMGRIVKDREYGMSNVQRNYFIADYLLYQQDFSHKVFFRDYMLDSLFHGSVVIGGYPRNTAFFDDEMRNRIRLECGIDEKEVIVYMPTWRGLLHSKKNQKQVEDVSQYLKELDTFLRDDQILYVKLHPFVKKKLSMDNLSHIELMPEKYDVYDVLNASDMLITDYSSIMFDYAVSGKKIILFAYDEEKYIKQRNSYLDINSLGLPVVHTIEELADEIGNERKPYDEFKETYCPYDNKDVTKNLLDLLLKQEDHNMKIISYAYKEEKKSLIYIDRLADDQKSHEIIKKVNQVAQENKKPYLCFKAAKMKKTSRKLSELDEKCGYIPLGDSRSYSLSEYIAMKLNLKFKWTLGGIKKTLAGLARKEFEKNFGKNKFDTVIYFEGLDRMNFHMLFSTNAKHVFCFRNFQLEKYNNSSKYKDLIDYVFTQMELIDVMYLPESMKGLPVAEHYFSEKMIFVPQESMADIITKEVM